MNKKNYTLKVLRGLKGSLIHGVFITGRKSASKKTAAGSSADKNTLCIYFCLKKLSFKTS